MAVPLSPVSMLVMPSSVRLFEVGAAPLAEKALRAVTGAVPAVPIFTPDELHQAEDAPVVDGEAPDGRAFDREGAFAAREPAFGGRHRP